MDNPVFSRTINCLVWFFSLVVIVVGGGGQLLIILNKLDKQWTMEKNRFDIRYFEFECFKKKKNENWRKIER